MADRTRANPATDYRLTERSKTMPVED